MVNRPESNKCYQWDAQAYEKFSEGQYRWALELIEKLALEGDETVLDIGCGNGKVTAILAERVPRGRVVGIDSAKGMIDLAQRKYAENSASRLIFRHLDVRKVNDLNRFDKVFSNAALHWVKNHPPVLYRIQRAMKTGGRLLFQMGGRGNAEEVVAVLESLISTAWTSYFSGFDFPYGFYGPDEYASWLADAGLKPMRVELIEKDMRHQGSEGLAGWIRTTWLPYIERVPFDRRESLIEDIVESYLNDHPLDDDGVAHVRMKRLEVEALKP